MTFNGTGVYLFGAKRDNHDVYGVILDGQGTMNNGFAPLPNDVPDFQQLLFGRGGLDPGEHTVELADLSDITNAPWLDLDFGIITLGDGNDSYVRTTLVPSPCLTMSAGPSLET